MATKGTKLIRSGRVMAVIELMEKRRNGYLNALEKADREIAVLDDSQQVLIKGAEVVMFRALVDELNDTIKQLQHAIGYEGTGLEEIAE